MLEGCHGNSDGGDPQFVLVLLELLEDIDECHRSRKTDGKHDLLPSFHVHLGRGMDALNEAGHFVLVAGFRRRQ